MTFHIYWRKEMHRLIGRVLAFCSTFCFLSATEAAPQNFSFAGNFSRDDNVQLFTFNANGASNVRLISLSYAGGIQSNGNVVARGGFDPILALFNSSGALVGQNDDAVSATTGACGGSAVNADSLTGERWDTCFNLALAAGSYTVAVMQYANFALGPNLSNGFTFTNSPTFTSTYGCSNGRFCDISGVTAGNNRTSAWAFDVRGVESAAVVPEPATFFLMGAGITGLIVFSRRSSRVL
jgi:hypothetical protein